MVLLLDAANTPFKDQAYARQQMLKFVREEYKPGQRTAIFTLTNSLERSAGLHQRSKVCC